MSDRPTAAPAGSSEQAATPARTGPMDMATAVDMLAGLDDEQQEAAAQPAPGGEEPVTETSETEGAAADPGGETQEVEESPSPEGEEGQPAEEAETEAETDEDQYAHGNMRTRLRDGTVTTVGELKRLADEAREYRAKAPQLAEQTQQLEQYRAREAQLAEREEALQRTLPLVMQSWQEGLPPAPDPALMDENGPNYDPIRYSQQDFNYRQALAKRQELFAAIQQRQQQQQQQAEQARAAELAKVIEDNRRALIEKIPDLADPAKGKAVYDRFVRTAEKYGFTKADLDGVYDHRLLHMVDDLARRAEAHDKLAAQKQVAATKVVEKPAVPVQRPGRSVPAAEAEQRALNERLQRFREGGRRLDDAAAILAELS